MKPASFKYYAPTSVEEALSLLAENGEDAKVLAGGQSLVPAMNFRLAQPSVLIDLNRINELSYINGETASGVNIGAMVRQRELERSALILERAPLISQTMPYIAHPQIRNRGTAGGSLAHADPAAELPAVMMALNARFRLRSQGGEREVSAAEFFSGMFATAIEPDELLVEIEIPAMPSGCGYSFQEVSRRHGDYALVGVAVTLSLDKNKFCRKSKIIFLSVGDAPVEAREAAQILQGQSGSEDVIVEAVEIAATKDIDPGDDIHASAAYRRHLAKTLTYRALAEAFKRALE